MSQKIKKQFISSEKVDYKIGFGNLIASSLSGFLAGAAVAILVIIALFDLTWK